MEDRLEEAIHVLRSHAVGQGPGLEGPHSDSLLPSAHNGGLSGLSPAFPNASLALSNRHPAMVGHLSPHSLLRFNVVKVKMCLAFPSLLSSTAKETSILYLSVTQTINRLFYLARYIATFVAKVVFPRSETRQLLNPFYHLLVIKRTAIRK